MRITEKQRQVIVQSAKEVFGEAEVRLFGSRMDDSKLGGDIDLLVKVRGVNQNKTQKSAALFAKICSGVGYELPIDIVIQDDSSQGLIYNEGMLGIKL